MLALKGLIGREDRVRLEVKKVVFGLCIRFIANESLRLIKNSETRRNDMKTILCMEFDAISSLQDQWPEHRVQRKRREI